MMDTTPDQQIAEQIVDAEQQPATPTTPTPMPVHTISLNVPFVDTRQTFNLGSTRLVLKSTRQKETRMNTFYNVLNKLSNALTSINCMAFTLLNYPHPGVDNVIATPFKTTFYISFRYMCNRFLASLLTGDVADSFIFNTIMLYVNLQLCKRAGITFGHL